MLQRNIHMLQNIYHMLYHTMYFCVPLCSSFSPCLRSDSPGHLEEKVSQLEAMLKRLQDDLQKVLCPLWVCHSTALSVAAYFPHSNPVQISPMKYIHPSLSVYLPCPVLALFATSKSHCCFTEPIKQRDCRGRAGQAKETCLVIEQGEQRR